MIHHMISTDIFSPSPTPAPPRPSSSHTLSGLSHTNVPLGECPTPRVHVQSEPSLSGSSQFSCSVRLALQPQPASLLLPWFESYIWN